MSPVEVKVPVTTRSALIMEGAAARVAAVRFGCCWACTGTGAATGVAVAASGEVSLGLLNMTACLNESARISHCIRQPHLIVDMRTGAATGGSEPSHRHALTDPSANAHQNR